MTATRLSVIKSRIVKLSTILYAIKEKVVRCVTVPALFWCKQRGFGFTVVKILVHAKLSRNFLYFRRFLSSSMGITNVLVPFFKLFENVQEVCREVFGSRSFGITQFLFAFDNFWMKYLNKRAFFQCSFNYSGVLIYSFCSCLLSVDAK